MRKLFDYRINIQYQLYALMLSLFTFFNGISPIFDLDDMKKTGELKVLQHFIPISIWSFLWLISAVFTFCAFISSRYLVFAVGQLLTLMGSIVQCATVLLVEVNVTSIAVSLISISIWFFLVVTQLVILVLKVPVYDGYQHKRESS